MRWGFAGKLQETAAHLVLSHSPLIHLRSFKDSEPRKKEGISITSDQGLVGADASEQEA